MLIRLITTEISTAEAATAATLMIATAVIARDASAGLLLTANLAPTNCGTAPAASPTTHHAMTTARLRCPPELVR